MQRENQSRLHYCRRNLLLHSYYYFAAGLAAGAAAFSSLAGVLLTGFFSSFLASTLAGVAAGAAAAGALAGSAAKADTANTADRIAIADFILKFPFRLMKYARLVFN